MARHFCEYLRGEEAFLIRHPERLQEDSNQNQNVVEALAQQRHPHRHHGQSKVKVFAETSPIDLALEIAVGRADHANVHLAWSRFADASNLPRLQCTQEFRLQLDR